MRRAWLQHGVNAAAMGAAARQLRAAQARTDLRSNVPELHGNLGRLGQKPGVVRAEHRPAGKRIAASPAIAGTAGLVAGLPQGIEQPLSAVSR